MVFYLGWMLYREQKTQQELTRADYAWRFGGFVATLVTSCALSTLHFSPVGFNETAGGIIGQIDRVSELIEIIQRQAPGTWLPLELKRGGEKRRLVAKFPARVK